MLTLQPDEFARKFYAREIRGLLTKRMIIPQGRLALFLVNEKLERVEGPGSLDVPAGVGQLVKGWFDLGRDENSVVLVSDREERLPFHFGPLESNDPTYFDLDFELRAKLKRGNESLLLHNLVCDKTSVTLEDVVAFLHPEVKQVVRGYLRTLSVRALADSFYDHSSELEQKIEAKLKQGLESIGLEFTRLVGLDLKCEAWDERTKRLAKAFAQVSSQQADLQARKNLFDVFSEQELQSIAEETKRREFSKQTEEMGKDGIPDTGGEQASQQPDESQRNSRVERGGSWLQREDEARRIVTADAERYCRKKFDLNPVECAFEKCDWEGNKDQWCAVVQCTFDEKGQTGCFLTYHLTEDLKLKRGTPACRLFDERHLSSVNIPDNKGFVVIEPKDSIIFNKPTTGPFPATSAEKPSPPKDQPLPQAESPKVKSHAAESIGRKEHVGEAPPAEAPGSGRTEKPPSAFRSGAGARLVLVCQHNYLGGYVLDANADDILDDSKALHHFYIKDWPAEFKSYANSLSNVQLADLTKGKLDLTDPLPQEICARLKGELGATARKCPDIGEAVLVGEFAEWPGFRGSVAELSAENIKVATGPENVFVPRVEVAFLVDGTLPLDCIPLVKKNLLALAYGCQHLSANFLYRVVFYGDYPKPSPGVLEAGLKRVSEGQKPYLFKVLPRDGSWSTDKELEGVLNTAEWTFNWYVDNRAAAFDAGLAETARLGWGNCSLKFLLIVCHAPPYGLFDRERPIGRLPRQDGGQTVDELRGGVAALGQCVTIWCYYVESAGLQLPQAETEYRKWLLSTIDSQAKKRSFSGDFPQVPADIGRYLS